MKNSIISSLILITTIQAQANTNEFMGSKLGDQVHVRSLTPCVDIKATFVSMTSSNITVKGRFDTIVIPINNLTTFEQIKTSTATVATTTTATTAQVWGSAAQAQQVAAGQSILGKFANDPGYTKANDYYKNTVNGVMDGSIKLDDIVKQAEQALTTLDQYQPEREKDPQYEGYISMLRSFLARAKAGEQIESPSIQ